MNRLALPPQFAGEFHDQDRIRHDDTDHHHDAHQRHDVHRGVSRAVKARMTPVNPGGTASKIKKGIFRRCELRHQDQINQNDRRAPGRWLKLLNDCRMPSTDPRMVTAYIFGAAFVFPIILGPLCQGRLTRSSLEGETYPSMTRRSW